MTRRWSASQWLLHRLADDQFATGAEDLNHFEALYGQSPAGRAREILVCLNLLIDPAEFGMNAERAPAADSQEDSGGEHSSEGGDGAEAEDDPHAKDESEVDVKEPKAQLGDPLLLPEVPVATGSKRRAEARSCAKSLLREEIQAWQATRDRDREDLLRTNAPYFRDSAIAKSKPESEVLLRREDSSFRQVGRLIDLLTKLKRDAWHAENKKITSKMKESPTMLLIIKDAIFYPTMLQKTKPVSSPIPRSL